MDLSKFLQENEYVDYNNKNGINAEFSLGKPILAFPNIKYLKI